MADEKKLSVSEVRRTIATSLGTAFGFVIGLVWSQVVLGGFATGGINLTNNVTVGNWTGWAIFLATALIVTLLMIVLIVIIGRWGSKT